MSDATDRKQPKAPTTHKETTTMTKPEDRIREAFTRTGLTEAEATVAAAGRSMSAGTAAAVFREAEKAKTESAPAAATPEARISESLDRINSLTDSPSRLGTIRGQ